MAYRKYREREEWSEENCIKLIREFRARPMLWDTKEPFFFRKALKLELWEDIGKTFNLPAKVCKHKMSILMSSFRREKSRIISRIKKSGKETSMMYKSSWFAFKEMAFLMDKESERKRQLTGTDEDDDDDNDDDDDDDDNDESRIKKMLLKHHIQPPIANISNHQQSGTDKKKSRIGSTAGPSQPVTEIDEETKSFANFIAFKMKKYTETTKNAVQQEICNIIFKADQNYFENYNDKFTLIDSENDPLDKTVQFEIKKETIIELDSDISD